MNKKTFKNMAKVVVLSSAVLLSYTGLNSTKVFAEEGNNTKFINNNNIVINNNDYQRLTSLGFSYNEILNMDSEEYSLNENLSGEIQSTDKKYFKVIEKVVKDQDIQSSTLKSLKSESEEPTTEVVATQEMTKEDFDKEVAAAKQKMDTPPQNSTFATDSHSTSYKVETTSVVKLSGSSNYRVKNDIEWVIMPKNRDYDVIGVALKSQWSGNKGSEYGKQTWGLYDFDTKKTTTGSSTYSTSKDASYWDIAGDGFGVKMNLKNDDKVVVPGVGYVGYEVRSLNLYMYYTVGKAVTNPARIDVYGRYAHATTTIKPSFGFSLSTALSAGFSFSLVKVEDFDISNHTVATIVF